MITVKFIESISALAGGTPKRGHRALSAATVIVIMSQLPPVRCCLFTCILRVPYADARKSPHETVILSLHSSYLIYQS